MTIKCVDDDGKIWSLWLDFGNDTILVSEFIYTMQGEAVVYSGIRYRRAT